MAEKNVQVDPNVRFSKRKDGVTAVLTNRNLAVAASSYSPEALADLKARATQNGLIVKKQMAEDLIDAASR